MKNFIFSLLFFFIGVCAFSQESTQEPDFIGEVLIKADSSNFVKMSKQMGGFASGMSWSSNSWYARSLELPGAKAETRVPFGTTIQLIVKAVDNESDPMSIIKIFAFKRKHSKRCTILSQHNEGTLLKSKNHTEDLLNFSAKKYGKSSYLIEITGIKKGEYGIIVSNPNGVDKKSVVVSCFGVD